MIMCKYCKEENVSSAHVRWCLNNPKREINKQKMLSTKRSNIQVPWNKGIKWEKKNKYSRGMTGRNHSADTKKMLKEKALASDHRRLKRKDIEYKGILLDSTWELYLAQRLDEQNIKWIRPDPVKWIDKTGNIHNYFPDFYLPEYDIYLDPKNPIAYKVQLEKIECLKEQLTNLYILCNMEEIINFTPVMATSSKR
jgi:hypothetical protein